MSMPARQVLDRSQLHVEEIADLPVAVGVLADAVKLQVGDAEARLLRLHREARILREPDPVGRGLDAVVADLAGVGNRLEENRRQGRLAT
jgi:hypothetical protein